MFISGKVHPDECRIGTSIENHDWLGDHTNGLTAADATIICNVGGVNIARSVCRIISCAHYESSIGKFKKTLPLHSVDGQEVGRRTRSK